MTLIDQIQFKDAILTTVTTAKLITDADVLAITSGADIGIDLGLPDFLR
jgi:hypothetical protein